MRTFTEYWIDMNDYCDYDKLKENKMSEHYYYNIDYYYNELQGILDSIANAIKTERMTVCERAQLMDTHEQLKDIVEELENFVDDDEVEKDFDPTGEPEYREER